jgi:hypothetical protein
MCPYRVTPEFLDQLKRQKRDFRFPIVLCLEFLAEYWLDATAGEGRIWRVLHGFGVSSQVFATYISDHRTATLQPVSTASSPHFAIAFTLSGYVSNARDLISERYTPASSCVCSSRQARRLCRRLVPEPAETDSAWRFCLIIAVMRLSILAMSTWRGRYAYGQIPVGTAQRQGAMQTSLHACSS